MTRGKILGVTREDALWRALSQIIAIPGPPRGAPADAGNKPINYRLKEQNGGDDPSANHCADWSYGLRTPTADCIGFVLWASGIDRFQPGYKGTRGEWLNCASLMDDAGNGQRFCRLLRMGEHPIVGDWLLTRDHIGFIIRPDPEGDDHLVVDCSPRHGRNRAVNTGYPWSDACVVVRPLIYGPLATGTFPVGP